MVYIMWPVSILYSLGPSVCIVYCVLFVLYHMGPSVHPHCIMRVLYFSVLCCFVLCIVLSGSVRPSRKVEFLIAHLSVRSTVRGIFAQIVQITQLCILYFQVF